MFKNVASQSIALFAFDTTTGAAKTGDAANMLFYIAKDWGTVTAIAANSGVPTEVDNANAKGWYKIAVSQTETNADAVLLSGKSSTSNISVVGLMLQTVPANFTTLSVDSSGRIDVGKTLGTAVTLDTNNVLNVSAKYLAGTALTGRDIGASVLLSAGTGTGQLDFTSGVAKSNPVQWLGGTIPAVNVTGVPLVDLKYTLGTLSPAAAGSVRSDVLTMQMTESYAALHAAPTLAQALFEVRALLAEKSITSTTLTANKIDGSTTAETFTLNDSVNPTAITRAS